MLKSAMSIMVLLFFVMACMHACDCSDAPLVGYEEVDAIVRLRNRLLRYDFPLLEIKMIKKDLDGGVDVCGGAFCVRHPVFWKEFEDVLCRGQDGAVVYSCKFKNMLKEIFLSAPGIFIEGLKSLLPEHRQIFLPSDEVVRWRVGPTDYVLLRKVPGSVTLCPKGEEYGLHFVPACPPERCCVSSSLRSEVRELRKNLKHNADVMASLRKNLMLLRGEQDELKDAFVDLQKKVLDFASNQHDSCACVNGQSPSRQRSLATNVEPNEEKT